LLESAKQLQEVVIKIQKHRFSGQSSLFEKLSKAALWILNLMDEKNTEKMRSDIEIAASMIYIGKLFLPDKSINDPVMIGGFAKNETMEQVPKFARELLLDVKGFEGVSDILSHIYENYDGSGIPDKIQSWEIPVGSRILRVILDFEEQREISKKPPLKIMENLDHESKRLYDFRCVTLLDQYLAASGTDRSAEERPLDPESLKSGNIISRSIITQSGIKLVSAGTVLKEDVVQKIISITALDPVVGYIWVKTR
jgi:response regulator RpfG family c-di-GMP phosphodiesterase